MADVGRRVTNALANTMLAGRELVEIAILDSEEIACALPLETHEVETAWRAARGAVDQTSMWPLVTTMWSGADPAASFAEQVIEENFFSRFYFEEAPTSGDVSPAALSERAGHVDVARFLEQVMAERQRGFDLDDAIDDALADLERRCGVAPDEDAIRNGTVDGQAITSSLLLERWMLDWELARGFEPDPERSRQGWYEPDPAVLLFLPIQSGWDALAYLNWYGTSDPGAENYVALGRSWEARFGAELVAHYGTMLQCLVTRPPRAFDEAWTLAVEHDLAGDCTLALSGIRLRDYARALIDWDRWFLHERP